MNALKEKFASICGSLGVEPKQLAIVSSLVVVVAIVLVVQFGGGAGKPTGPPKASKKPTAASQAAPETGPITFQLQTQPMRDPFAGNGLTAGSGPIAAIGPSRKGPGALQLQATMSGEYAVINGKAIALGGRVIDTSTGRIYELTEVGLRRAVLQSGDERIEIPFDP